MFQHLISIYLFASNIKTRTHIYRVSQQTFQILQYVMIFKQTYTQYYIEFTAIFELIYI